MATAKKASAPTKRAGTKRASGATATPTPNSAASRITRVTEWNGIKRGDLIKAEGIEGTFVFQSYASIQLEGGGVSEWVDAFGGSGGRRMMRSFRPEVVRLTRDDIGARLLEMRTAKNLSRRQLGEKAGLSPAAIGRIESKGRVSTEELDALTQVLGPIKTTEPKASSTEK